MSVWSLSSSLFGRAGPLAAVRISVRSRGLPVPLDASAAVTLDAAIFSTPRAFWSVLLLSPQTASPSAVLPRADCYSAHTSKFLTTVGRRQSSPCQPRRSTSLASYALPLPCCPPTVSWKWPRRERRPCRRHHRSRPSRHQRPEPIRALQTFVCETDTFGGPSRCVYHWVARKAPPSAAGFRAAEAEFPPSPIFLCSRRPPQHRH